MQGKRSQVVTAVHRWQTRITYLSWRKEVLWRVGRMSERIVSVPLQLLRKHTADRFAEYNKHACAKAVSRWQ